MSLFLLIRVANFKRKARRTGYSFDSSEPEPPLLYLMLRCGFFQGYTCVHTYMGGCQNSRPLGTLNIRCRIIIRTQKGTLGHIHTYMFPESPIPLN